MRVFGPIPSRRLGKSLGVNNIPAKNCSYSCVYCQVGRTNRYTLSRETFFAPETLFEEVREKVAKLEARNEPIDYITIVPDGEPTLDINLGTLINMLQTLSYPVAVISNSTLLYMPEVRQDLMHADLVSVKVDTVLFGCWDKINRPHVDLSLARIESGLKFFAAEYPGTLISETMLVKGLNDNETCLEATAAFLQHIQPETAYLMVPTRPPAEKWALPPDESTLNQAYQIFQKFLPKVEYLMGYEGNDFASTGDVEEDILSITAVHPMREDAIRAYLKKTGEDFSVIDKLVNSGQLVITMHEGKRYFLRKLIATPV